MKIYIKSIIALLFIAMSVSLYSQAPPPPPPDHGSSGNQNGGNAPIGSGLAVLLGLGAAYGARKIYIVKNLSEDD